MNFTLPSSKALVRDGLYGAGGSAGFAAGRGGVGGTTAVFVVNDRVSSGGGVFDGVIYSIFGGTALWYFGADTPFDGTVDGITLVAGSAGDVSSVFTDTSLPSSIDLNQFPKRIASMHFGYPPTTQAVLGTVDRLYINGKLVSVAVPEPSIYSLVVLSGAIFGIGAWRRSKNDAPPPSSVPSRFERG